jgi:arabinan endo-1,5-alpha-L-arabinosidase
MTPASSVGRHVGGVGPEVPHLATACVRVFVPRGGRYINDHCLIKGPDGTWHLFAITQVPPESGPTDPKKEKSFLHATAPGLYGPWTEHDDVMVADPELDELVLWAPHILDLSSGDSQRYVMHYWTESEPRGLRRAESRNLWEWERVEANGVDPSLRPPGGRDPYGIRVGDRWLLYSVNSPWGLVEHGEIVVSANEDVSDPRGWSPHQPVIEHQRPLTEHRFFESPCVVPRSGNGYFYLFVASIGPEPWEYSNELVFRSEDPERFTWPPVARFDTHASKVVEEDGRYHLTSCGWPEHIGEEKRGLLLGELAWSRTDAESGPGSALGRRS